MKTKLTERQIQIMKDDISAQIAEDVVRDFGCSVQEALDILFTSDTFELLQDNETGLYYQSPGYVYSFLKNEILTAKAC